MWRLVLILFLAVLPLRAQDADGEDGCGSETEIITSDPGDGALDIDVAPLFEEPKERPDPNRPPAVTVGIWPPPPLDADKQGALDRLVRARDAAPGDRAARYRLAEFYLRQGFHPHAEREFLAAAKLDPESIRPWEGVLRVYAKRPSEGIVTEFGPGFRRVRNVRRNDWLESVLERNRRITRAYRELLKRRSDALEHRRAFVLHLKKTGEYADMAVEARGILKRMPRDAEMRYELAEALRCIARQASPKTQGKGRPEWTRALAELDKNHNDHPGHLRTRIRLARMLCLEKGKPVTERVTELERRAFFELFIIPAIQPVPYRRDTFRLASAVCGQRVAHALWDDAMGFWELENPRDSDRRHFDRWVYLAFPNNHPRERKRIVDTLYRRGDQSAVGILLALLWHMEESGNTGRRNPFLQPLDYVDQIEGMAVDAVGALGPFAYSGADRFLKAADTMVRRRRGVALVAAIGDPRAVRQVVGVLALDRFKQYSLGSAAALEKLGDKSAVDALVEAALDVQRPIPRRREAVEALAVFGDPRSIEVMRRLAKDEQFVLQTSYGLFRLTGDQKALELMRKQLANAGAAQTLRLAAKCPSPRVQILALDALEKGAEEERPMAVALLQKRFWKTAKPAVREFFLRQAQMAQPAPFTLKMLGELGGEKVVDRLLQFLQTSRGDTWEQAARALAQTGDPRAVRHFNRMRILDRDSKRRRIARELHIVAAKRRAGLVDKTPNR